MTVAKIPVLDPAMVSRRLRKMLEALSPQLGRDEDPFSCAARQVAGTPDHPVPCTENCRPCAVARAILLIETHQVQTTPVEVPPDALFETGPEVRALAEATRQFAREVARYLPVLAAHVERWRRIHQALEPLQGPGEEAEKSHNHHDLCERPAIILSGATSLDRALRELAESLLESVRPEVRAIGHRPPDTLVVDLVRILESAGYDGDQLAALFGRDRMGEREREYWVDRVERALRKGAPPT